MTVKKKNKRILIVSIIATVAVLICLSVLFFAYRSNQDATSCKALIKEVSSESSQDPLYEPPVQFFECIGAI